MPGFARKRIAAAPPRPRSTGSGLRAPSSRPLRVQAKLEVAASGDRYEREADQVAGLLAAGPAPGAPGGRGGPAPAPAGVRRAGRGVGFAVGGAIEAAVAGARGRGRPLPGSLRRRMEEGLGADLGPVRVHTDEPASRLSRALHARAFTAGRDLFFRHGEWNPAGRSGREVIAHELAHVVQQGAAGPSLPGRGPSPPAPAGLTPTPRPAPVQRLVGFEAELSVPVVRYGHGTLLDFINGGMGVASLTPDLKDDAHSSFYLESDHDEISGEVKRLRRYLIEDDVLQGEDAREIRSGVANIEYVIKPKDELAPGASDAIGRGVGQAVVHMNDIWATHPRRNQTRLVGNRNYRVGVPSDDDWRAGIGGTNLLAAYPRTIRAIRDALSDRLYLQATAGIVASAIPDFLFEVGRDPEYSQADYRELNRYAVLDAEETVDWLRGESDEADQLRALDRASLAGWLALLYAYLAGNEVYQTEAFVGGNYKNFVTFLSKADLGLARQALTDAAWDFIRGIGGDLRGRLVAHIQERADLTARYIRRRYERVEGEDPLIDDVPGFIEDVVRGNRPNVGLNAIDQPPLGLDDLPDAARDDREGIRQSVPLEFREIRTRPTPDNLWRTLEPIVRDVQKRNTDHLPRRTQQRILDAARANPRIRRGGGGDGGGERKRARAEE